MKDKDLIIENEDFITEKDYRLLVDKIWIHNSIGGHVTLDSCTFHGLSLFDEKFIKELNENLGFKLFEELE